MAGTAADEFLAKLNDPAKWVVKRSVPVFRAHTRKVVRNGKKVEIKVTDSDLEKIASAMRDAESDAGTVAVITPGHLKDEGDESAEPPVYGYLRNARVGEFGPAKIKCVLADEFYKPEDADLAKDYPYRSADYYPNDFRISAVALLKNRPAQDLGCVSFKNGTFRVRYSYSEKDMGEPAGGNTAMPEMAPEEKALADKMHAYYCASPEHMQRFSDSMPKEPDVEPDEDTDEDKDMDKDKKVDNASEDLRVQYREMGERLGATEKLLKDALAERDRERCERYVSELKAERYILDEPFEVKTLLRMDEQSRAEYLKNVRARYSKVPDGKVRVADTEPVTLASGDGKSLTKDGMMKAVRYQADKKVSWEEAREAVLSGKVK